MTTLDAASTDAEEDEECFPRDAEAAGRTQIKTKVPLGATTLWKWAAVGRCKWGVQGSAITSVFCVEKLKFFVVSRWFLLLLVAVSSSLKWRCQRRRLSGWGGSLSGWNQMFGA